MCRLLLVKLLLAPESATHLSLPGGPSLDFTLSKDEADAADSTPIVTPILLNNLQGETCRWEPIVPCRGGGSPKMEARQEKE